MFLRIILWRTPWKSSTKCTSKAERSRSQVLSPNPYEHDQHVWYGCLAWLIRNDKRYTYRKHYGNLFDASYFQQLTLRKKRHDSNSGDSFESSKVKIEALKKNTEVLWLISSESTRQRRGRAGRFARALWKGQIWPFKSRQSMGVSSALNDNMKTDRLLWRFTVRWFVSNIFFHFRNSWYRICSVGTDMDPLLIYHLGMKSNGRWLLFASKNQVRLDCCVNMVTWTWIIWC